MPKSSKSPSTPDDDDIADVEAVEAMLAADDPTLDRYWRYKVLGKTMAQITATLARKNQVRFEANTDDYRIVVAAAQHSGLSVAAYTRLAVARAIMLDFDLTPNDIPSLARDAPR